MLRLAQDLEVQLIITPSSHFRPRFERGEVPAPIPGGPALYPPTQILAGSVVFFLKQAGWVCVGNPFTEVVTPQAALRGSLVSRARALAERGTGASLKSSFVVHCLLKKILHQPHSKAGCRRVYYMVRKPP
jgi:hypothetical protein